MRKTDNLIVIEDLATNSQLVVEAGGVFQQKHSESCLRGKQGGGVDKITSKRVLMKNGHNDRLLRADSNIAKVVENGKTDNALDAMKNIGKRCSSDLKLPLHINTANTSFLSELRIS